MSLTFCRFICALALILGAAFATLDASAATISFSGNSSDGHPVSATAEFTPGANTVTVKLTNTTATTLDAGELFTGLDFSLDGLTPTLGSKTAIQRTVDGSGIFTDTGSPQDISWSLVSNGGGSFQLNFNPNAKDSIIAPPSSGNYSGANSSIKGNGGHNPFAAQFATFVLNVPGATAATPVSVTSFRFGTELDPGIPVPEPTTCALLAIGLLFALQKRAR